MFFLAFNFGDVLFKKMTTFADFVFRIVLKVFITFIVAAEYPTRFILQFLLWSEAHHALTFDIPRRILSEHKK